MATYAGHYDEILLRKSGSRLAPAAAETTVLVYESDGTTVATLYTSRTKSATAANPIDIDDAGNLEFFAEPGTYVIAIREGGVQVATDTVAVPYDPVEGAEATLAAETAQASAASSEASAASAQAAAEALLPVSTDHVIYVGRGTNADDANDGLTPRRAKATIQAAINALPATGGVVQLLYGTYALTVALTVVDGLTLRGLGYGTLIQAGAGTNNVLVNISGKYNVVVEAMAFDGRRATGNAENLVVVTGASENVTLRNLICVNAGAAAVSVKGSAAKVTVEDVKASAGKWGIELAACSDVKVTDLHVSGSTTTAVAEGGVFITNTTRASFVNCSSRANAGHGAWIGGTASDVRFTNCDFSSNGTTGNDHRGVTLANTASVTFVNCSAKNNVECGFYSPATTRIRLIGCEAEGNNTDFRPGGHGFEILGPGSLSSCRSVGTLGNASNEGCGYYIAGPASLTDCDAELNYSHGIRIYDGANVNIKGGIIRANSQRVAGGHSGIALDGATGTSHVQISGVRAYDDQGIPTQEYGIAVSSVVNSYQITGCDLVGNRTGGLSDAGGSTKVISDNLGTTLISTADAPRQVAVDVLAAPVAQVGSSSYVHNGVFPGAQVRQIPDAINNSISYDVELGPGTWRLDMLHYRNSNIGIYTFNLDGTALTSFSGSATSIDGYNASGSPTSSQITGIVIPSAGVRRLTITMASKNASATNFFGQINSVIFTRTA